MHTKPQVFLFQHVAYLGGVWQATRTLVTSLVEINRERRQLRLALGVANEQEELEELIEACPELSIERLDSYTAWGFQLRQRLGAPARPLRRFSRYFFFSPGKLALESDLWFALVDRFRRPLAPLRPYGLLIHDMIHKHSPETFSRSFNCRIVPRGIKPTVRGSQFQVTTTPATGNDVLSFYGTDKQFMRVIPVAHEPAERFGRINARPVADLACPFFLNIANASPHKGCKTLLQGFSKWKQQRLDKSMRLVVCGCGTEQFSNQGPEALSEYARDIRNLVKQCGLVEGKDVVFLGYVNDETLKYLLEQSAAVINAANHDNGSYSMIEAVWFGKPIISSDYPAAAYVNARFDLDCIFFQNENPQSLAEALEIALRKSLPDVEQVALAQKGLERSELSHRVYAERFYESLVENARISKSV